MGAWFEVFRWVGTLVVLGLIALVMVVALVFEAPRNWPRRERSADRSELDRGHHAH